MIAIINLSVQANNLGELAFFDISSSPWCSVCFRLGPILDVSHLNDGDIDVYHKLGQHVDDRWTLV